MQHCLHSCTIFNRIRSEINSQEIKFSTHLSSATLPCATKYVSSPPRKVSTRTVHSFEIRWRVRIEKNSYTIHFTSYSSYLLTHTVGGYSSTIIIILHLVMCCYTFNFNSWRNWIIFTRKFFFYSLPVCYMYLLQTNYKLYLPTFDWGDLDGTNDGSGLLGQPRFL